MSYNELSGDISHQRGLCDLKFFQEKLSFFGQTAAVYTVSLYKFLETVSIPKMLLNNLIFII